MVFFFLFLSFDFLCLVLLEKKKMFHGDAWKAGYCPSVNEVKFAVEASVGFYPSSMYDPRLLLNRGFFLS